MAFKDNPDCDSCKEEGYIIRMLRTCGHEKQYNRVSYTCVVCGATLDFPRGKEK